MKGGGGGGSKCDVIKRGEDYCDGSVTEGGEGVQNSLNLCDVIYERLLCSMLMFCLREQWRIQGGGAPGARAPPSGRLMKYS